MTWAYLLLETLYVVGLLFLIALSLVAVLQTRKWISVFEAVLLFGVCVSAITLFESPPRTGVVGLIVCASLLCISAYRRWRVIEAERTAAALAASQAAQAATDAASAAKQAAHVATDAATCKAHAETALAATASADAANEAAHAASDAASAAMHKSNEDAIVAAKKAARELAAAKATKRYGDENANNS